MNDLGKPDAGEPHVRFDEEALETGATSWWDDLGTGSKGPGNARPPPAQPTAPVPYSTFVPVAGSFTARRAVALATRYPLSKRDCT